MYPFYARPLPSSSPMLYEPNVTGAYTDSDAEGLAYLARDVTGIHCFWLALDN